MNLNPDIRLRSLGRHHIIVDASPEQTNFTNVYELNPTAAWLWGVASEGDFTAETLADALCAEYEVDRATALADAEAVIEKWRRFGFILP